MKKFGFVAIVLAMVMGIALTACSAVLSSSDYLRYKITVTVETPEGLKTGSAVREAYTYYEKSILPEQGGRTYGITKGEAVVVDLGSRGLLFLLLDGGDEGRIIFKTFPNKKVGSVVLTPDQYPKFVHFKDLQDPKTVEALLDFKSCADPITQIRDSSMCIEKDHFEEIFGQGVKLKSITVEITEDELTFGLVKYLPWLPLYYNKMLDGQRFNIAPSKYPLTNSLQSGSFSVNID